MSRIETMFGAKSAPTGKPRKPAVKPSRTQNRADQLTRYAQGGVGTMAVLSALLNGYANAQHATIPWAGWGLGLVIPVIVLILGKVAGLLYQRKSLRLSYAAGGTGAGLLFLSVWHCATSVSLLTGSPWYLTLPIAVAIDCGLVVCEIAALSTL